MKKILVLFFLSMFLYNPSGHAMITGKGEVKLTERALQNFLWYLRGDWPERKTGRYVPAYFILSSNGNWSYFLWCPYNECWSNERPHVAMCERETGVPCGAFAVRRRISWDNGINTSKKRAKFTSKMSDEEVKSELNRLGFYGEIENQSNSINLSEQLQSLKKLYEDGILTKEEYKKAKKKILN
jgi:uncharacterized protein YqgQ